MSPSFWLWMNIPFWKMQNGVWKHSWLCHPRISAFNQTKLKEESESVHTNSQKDCASRRNWPSWSELLNFILMQQCRVDSTLEFIKFSGLSSLLSRNICSVLFRKGGLLRREQLYFVYFIRARKYSCLCSNKS